MEGKLEGGFGGLGGIAEVSVFLSNSVVGAA